MHDTSLSPPPPPLPICGPARKHFGKQTRGRCNPTLLTLFAYDTHTASNTPPTVVFPPLSPLLSPLSPLASDIRALCDDDARFIETEKKKKGAIHLHLAASVSVTGQPQFNDNSARTGSGGAIYSSSVPQVRVVRRALRLVWRACSCAAAAALRLSSTVCMKSNPGWI